MMKKKSIVLDSKHKRLVIWGNSVQSINMREWELIKNLEMDFLPLEIEKDSVPVRLVGKLDGMIPLGDFLNTAPISRSMFIRLIGRILELIQQVDKHKLSKDLLSYSIEYMFIKVPSLALVMTYIPLQPFAMENNSIGELFNTIVGKASFDSSEETDYITEFLQIIKDRNISFYVLKEYVDFWDGRKDLTPNNTSQDKASESNNVLLATNTECCALIDRRTKQRIEIKTCPFKIGKLAAFSDLLIENDCVSRNHAEIIKEENKFFIVDKTSKNGTFVNGHKIQSGIKVLIHSGDIIGFADSEYSFEIMGR